MPSLRARLANRLIWTVGEFYTTDPRGPQLRGWMQRAGVATSPRLQLPHGWRRLLDGTELPVLRRVDAPADTRLGGVSCHVFNESGATDGTIVYLHGGGFVAGSLASHGTLAQAIARATGRRLVFVDYRLAPEHTHPAALEDVVDVWRALLADGLDPARGALMGDSAGGNLTLTAPLKLLREGIALPGALVALSPVTDATLSGESMRANRARDAMLCERDIRIMAETYAPDPDDRRDPLLSPLFADPAELAQLPPTLIQVSDAEVLLDDARGYAARCERAGGRVDLDIWPDLPHVWQGFAGLVPEADAAIAEVANWLRHH